LGSEFVLKIKEQGAGCGFGDIFSVNKMAMPENIPSADPIIKARPPFGRGEEECQI
jgi:hypothetical protein